jgi:hemerythrin-like metal-binding protein
MTIGLGYPAMDAVHQEFDRLLARCQAARDAELHGCLLGLQSHLADHFSQEDRWMRDTGFPATDCHVGEHAAVLRSAAEVLPRVAAGDTRLGREFVTHLAEWFPAHANRIDSALAAWLCKRQYGGQPVVLHRKTSFAPQAA